MKNNKDHFEENIARLLKTTDQNAEPAATFVQGLVSEAVAQLGTHNPATGRVHGKFWGRRWLAAAATFVVGAAGLIAFWVTMSQPQTLYAQAMEALRQARTIHVVGWAWRDGVKTQRAEVWYEQGVGVKEVTSRKGKSRIRIDNGQYEWTYHQGQEYAVRGQSRDPVGLVEEVLDPMKFLKRARRDAGGDREIDGVPCELYVGEYPAGTKKYMVWLDGRKQIRRYEEEELIEGTWQPEELIVVTYDVPVDRTCFEPTFGQDVRVVVQEEVQGQIFALDKALYTKQVMGLVFAVHELHREGNRLYVACSLRVPEETLEKVGRDERSNGLSNQYGDFQLTRWGQRDQAGNWQSRPYEIDTLGRVDHDGIEFKWCVLEPKGTWEGIDKEYELCTYIYTRGKLQEWYKEQGLPWHERFRPLVTLPLPQEQTSAEAIIEKIYAQFQALESVRLWQMQPRPSRMSRDDFAAQIRQKLTGVLPMRQVWQEQGSEVVVRVVDEQGNPMPAVKVATRIMQDGDRWRWFIGSSAGQKEGEQERFVETDEQGRVVLRGEDLFAESAAQRRVSHVVALMPERGLMAVEGITASDFGKEVVLTMKPGCLVRGKVNDAALRQAGKQLRNLEIDVSCSRKYHGRDVLTQRLNGPAFEVLLPAGTGAVRGSVNYDGSDRMWLQETGYDVAAGDKEKDLGTIELQ